MKLKRFTLSPTQLIRLYLSHDEDGWDCHHQQKQTQRLISRNYAGVARATLIVPFECTHN